MQLYGAHVAVLKRDWLTWTATTSIAYTNSIQALTISASNIVSCKPLGRPPEICLDLRPRAFDVRPSLSISKR